ncbi:MAG TPA: hypothetical protein PKU85_01145 [Bacteroidales bacterium]|nr:MAG: hypothetical protein BWX62_00247 [Bacteroidetes bacterium ADurb.Bin037]HPV87805.1 hypothetical protein [Bacteroidales bacterium]HPW78056.1 hypothetical protein [Bacteroidales bacterium]HQB55252.1 hypothetical protein [Bacteroidales bacterium]
MNRSLIVFLLCLMPVCVYAQEQRPRKSDQERRAEREAVQAQKVAFITQKVGFTAEEAEKFWPLYNEMEGKIRVVVHKRGRAKAEMYRLLEPSDEGRQRKGATPPGSSQGRTAAGDHRDLALPEKVATSPKGPATAVEDVLETFIMTFEEENQVRMEYHRKFLNVLSAEQVARFYLAEEHFSNKLFREYINRKINEKSR